MVHVGSAICVNDASIAGGEIDSKIVHSKKCVTICMQLNELNKIVMAKRSHQPNCFMLHHSISSTMSFKLQWKYRDLVNLFVMQTNCQ